MASVLNTPTASANSAVTPRTLAVTVSSGTDKSVFIVTMNSSVTLDACTLNGTAFSRKTRTSQGIFAWEFVEFDSPATGDLVLTYSAAPNNQIIQYDLDGVAAGAAEDINAETTTGDERETVLTTTVGAVVLLATYDESNTAMTPAGGLTEDTDFNPTEMGGRFATGNLIADATSETPSFGTTVGEYSGVIGASYAPEAAPPATPYITLQFNPLP